MDGKSFYYLATWDDASLLSKALHALDIPHAVESPGSSLNVPEGNLAIVFPHLKRRQYLQVRELFGEEALDYPLAWDHRT